MAADERCPGLEKLNPSRVRLGAKSLALLAHFGVTSLITDLSHRAEESWCRVVMSTQKSHLRHQTAIFIGMRIGIDSLVVASIPVIACRYQQRLPQAAILREGKSNPDLPLNPYAPLLSGDRITSDGLDKT